MTASGLWFVVVGATAAATHMGVFEGLRPHMLPELANAIGFCVAFVVSFSGHRLLSFRDAATSVKQSLGRFALTALAGFVGNEIVFIALTRVLGVAPLPALFVALVFAAGQTFLLSRFWAFRR